MGNALRWRLGIDMGVSSLGWAVVEIDDAGIPLEVVDVGVRAYTSPMHDENKQISRAAARRENRTARRGLSRRAKRLAGIRATLVDLGIWQTRNDDRTCPIVQGSGAHRGTAGYMFRARGLGEPLTLQEFGWAVVSLAARRGPSYDLKSDPEVVVAAKGGGKSASDEEKAAAKEAASTKAAIKRTREMVGDRTPGEWAWSVLTDPTSNRAIRNSVTNVAAGSLVVFHREDLRAEYRRLWDAQAVHYPNVLTGEARERLEKVIFDQRPLATPPRSACPYENADPANPTYFVTNRHDPAYQRFRVAQTVNNLRFHSPSAAAAGGPSKRGVTQAERDILIAHLSTVEAAKPSVLLKMLGIQDLIFDLPSRRKNKKSSDDMADLTLPDIPGNAVNHQMRLALKDHGGLDLWEGQFDLHEQGDIIDQLMDSRTSAAETITNLVAGYPGRLTPERVEAMLRRAPALPTGTARMSSVAAERLGDFLLAPYEDPTPPRFSDAVSAVYGRAHSVHVKGDGQKLPFYGDVLPTKITAIAGNPALPNNPNGFAVAEVEQNGRISNPIVHVALNELRKVYNCLWEKYGPPAAVNIETARDLSNSAEKRIELKARSIAQGKAAKKRIEAMRAALGLPDSHGFNPTEQQHRRWRLFEQIAKDGVGECVYTGTKISAFDALNPATTEVDHIIPFARSQNDRFSNVILCTVQANRDKGPRTPFEAFGADHARWEAIMARVDHHFTYDGKEGKIQTVKAKRFDPEFADTKTFASRALNDTRYMTALARAYIATAVGDTTVLCPAGTLTHQVRHKTGLDTVIATTEVQHDQTPQPDGTVQITEKTVYIKNRDDLRHHGVDAIAIALINRSMIQKAAIENQGRRTKPTPGAPENPGSPDADEVEVIHVPDRLYPWVRAQADSLLDDVVISHRPDHDPTAGLSKDTIYSLVKPAGEDGMLTLGLKKRPSVWLKAATNDAAITLTPDEARHWVSNGIDLSASLQGRVVDPSGTVHAANCAPRNVECVSLYSLFIQALTTEIPDPDETHPHLPESERAQIRREAKAERLAAFHALDQYGMVQSTRRSNETSVVPVRNRAGQITGYKMASSNYCTEIVRQPDGNLSIKVINTLTAMSKPFRTHLEQNPHLPYDTDGELIVRLRKNDLVRIEGDPHPRRVVKMSPKGTSVDLLLRHHALAVPTPPANATKTIPKDLRTSKSERLATITPARIGILGASRKP